MGFGASRRKLLLVHVAIVEQLLLTIEFEDSPAMCDGERYRNLSIPGTSRRNRCRNSVVCVPFIRNRLSLRGYDDIWVLAGT